MFAILKTAPFGLLTEAAYRISLRIRERHRFPTWRKWIAVRPDGEPDPAAVALASRVLGEIERRTGKPLAEVADAEIALYQGRINDILDARYAAAYPDPDGIGERILEELRRDYGRPDGRAAA